MAFLVLVSKLCLCVIRLSVVEPRRHFLRAAIRGGVVAGVLALAGSVPAEVSPSSHVAAVRDLGLQFQDNAVNVTGQDAATSTVLPSGEALWLFGDTIEGPFATIRGLALDDKLSNTGAIVPSQDASRGIRQFHFLAPARRKSRFPGSVASGATASSALAPCRHSA